MRREAAESPICRCALRRRTGRGRGTGLVWDETGAVEKMPKKKRKTANEPHSPDQEEKSDVKLTCSFGDTCIVISDSDGEQESREEHSLQKKRKKQQLDRGKFAAKRKIAHMTEDEQFALALKMSEQEARQLNSQEEEEEELLRKAIAESLSTPDGTPSQSCVSVSDKSCQTSEFSDAAAVPLLSRASVPPIQSHLAGQEDAQLLAVPIPCSESPCSRCSSLSPNNNENRETDVAKRPLVVLTRLSQEIVESSLVSSIIVSPGKDQPFAKSNPSSPAGSSSSLEEEMPVTQSPTFPQRPLCSWPVAPQRVFIGTGSLQMPTEKEMERSQNYLKGDVHDGCSEAPEQESQQHNTLEHARSPPKFGDQSEHKSESVERTVPPENALSICRADEKSQHEEKDVVHYYWGVPFCPRGIDPNKYTQVIMCQLEVYQKSLKQAQRQLLQKKRFGEPLVPNSRPLGERECGKEEEASGQREDTDELEREDMDEKKEPERGAWLLSPANGELYKHSVQDMAEGRNSEECGDEPASSSSQLSQVLFAEDALEEREPPQITQSICALTPLDSKKSPDIATENHAEEEITVCPETQQSPLQAIKPESGEMHSSSKDDSLQAHEDAREHTSLNSPQSDDPIPCPLCEHRFSASEIELHAMYCNGTGEDAIQDGPVMTRRQREARSKLANCKEASKSVDIDKYEKCYICKSLVSWKEYQKHVEGCLRSRNADGAPGHMRLQHAKLREEGRCGGRLLSLLEQSEHTAAEEEVTTRPSRGEGSRHSLAELDKAAEGNQNTGRCFPPTACPDSPIRSFTSISEAKDCLVDFKKQLKIDPNIWKPAKAKASQRRRMKF